MPTACAFTQSGTAMATKNDAQSEADTKETEGEGAEAAAPKRRFSLKLIAMVVGGIVVLGGVAGGGWYFFGHSSNTAAAATQVKPPIFVDMPDVLVNLSSAGGDARTQYLKVKISLELPDEAVQAQIQPIMPRLLDTFQTY